MLAIKNLTKIFGNKKVLDNVTFSVDKGSIAVFLGPSGVGKSTLLRLLNNLETIDNGTITLDGKSLDAKTIRTGHTCGMVFQQFNLFDHLTVLENITLALKKVLGKSAKESEQIAKKLLKQYGLTEKANVYPGSLSGGQKQRLALARTIALEPRIICFDEPTSALDPLLTTHVAQTIQELAHKGYIVLIASHDTVLLDKLDCNIYLMDDGTIVEQATTKDFRSNKNNYPRITRFVAGHIESDNPS